MHHHDGIGGVHLDDAGLKTTDGTRYLRILEHHRCGEFVKTRLTDKQLIVSEIVGLYNIDTLLNLTGDLDNLILIAPSCDGVFVYTRNAGGRYVQTLNIHLTARKHSRHLIQDTSHVLRINQKGI